MNFEENPCPECDTPTTFPFCLDHRFKCTRCSARCGRKFCDACWVEVRTVVCFVCSGPKEEPHYKWCKACAKVICHVCQGEKSPDERVCATCAHVCACGNVKEPQFPKCGICATTCPGCGFVKHMKHRWCLACDNYEPWVANPHCGHEGPDGFCFKCQSKFRKGTEIWWKSGIGTMHTDCQPAAPAAPKPYVCTCKCDGWCENCSSMPCHEMHRNRALGIAA